MRPHPEYCIFPTSLVNAALTDLLFCIGKLVVAIAMGPECDVYKQIDVIVSDSLLSKEYEMEFIKIA